MKEVDEFINLKHLLMGRASHSSGKMKQDMAMSNSNMIHTILQQSVYVGFYFYFLKEATTGTFFMSHLLTFLTQDNISASSTFVPH